MKRKRDHLVTVQKDGFQPKSVPVVKDVGGAVWGNIIAGGFIGWGVDAASGAQYNLNPTSINVSLEEVDEGASETTSQQATSDFVRELNGLDDLKDGGTISDEEYMNMRVSLFRRYFPEMDPEAIGGSSDPPAAE